MNIEPKSSPQAEESSGSIDPHAHAQAFQKQRLWVSMGAVGLAFAGLILWFSMLNGVNGSLPIADDAQAKAAGISPELGEQTLDCAGDQKDSPVCEERRQAISALRSVIGLEDELVQKQVRLWAEGDFSKALHAKSQGDEEYTNEFFRKAKATYNNSETRLASILEYGDALAKETTVEGYAALDQELSGEAVKSFELALAIQPSSLEAIEGLARAKVLDQVTGLLDEGDSSFQTGRLKAAETTYREAVTLDPKNSRAIKSVEVIKEAIVEKSFQTALSEGFAAFQANKTRSSVSSFKKALTIRPNSNPALQGLAQAEHLVLENRIKDLRASAEGSEKLEDWKTAFSSYQSILSVDSAIGFAKTGLARSAIRVSIEKRLDLYLNKSERLSSPAVLAEADTFLSEISRIGGLGQRLDEKSAKLAGILDTMSTPVAVKIESDNRTSVRILRYGDLNRFRQRELKLRPGKYTMIGSRDGYKTVRLEFHVKPEQQEIRLSIACHEAF